MKSIQHDDKPIVKTKSIIFKIIISFTILLIIYSIVLLISILKLNEDKTIFDNIVTDTMPKIIDTNSYHSNIKELSYLIEKLNNAKTQSIRRVIHERIIQKIALIQKMSIKLDIKRDDLDKKLFLIKSELVHLNEIVNKQLSIKDTINKNIQNVNELNHNIILFISKNNKLNSKHMQTLKFNLQKIMSLSYESISLDKLNQLRLNNEKITILREKLNNAKPFKKLVENIDKIIINKNGIIDLKIQYVKMNGQVQGHANFVNTLIKDFATSIEYEIFKSIQNLTSKAHSNSTKVQKQTNYIYIIYIFSFLFLLIIIMYINKILVSRLSNLNYNINTKLLGKKSTIEDDYNDEISQIVKTFNFYSNKVEEQKKELEKLAITDKLTGIYNRRQLDIIVSDEINRVKRFNKTFSLTILDIDYFKRVNDSYGHHIGDSVLIEISELLKANVRESDYIGRWGGEEFVIISPEIKIEGLIQFIEKIRKIIENYNFSTAGNLTASFGITVYTKEDTIKSIIQRADEALYKAKASGRNKVEYLK